MNKGPRSIHLNPIRAKMVTEVAQYPWSSHRAYIGKEEIPWLSTTPLLRYFGDSIQQARTAFDEMVRGKLEEGHRDQFHTGSVFDARVLGDDSFVEVVQGQSEDDTCQKPGLGAIVRAVEVMYGLKEGELACGGKTFALAEARSLAAWATLEMSDATLTALGKMVGRDVSSLSSSITRLHARGKNETAIVEKQARLRMILSGEIATLQA